jgi:formylglycine-generating enzyme required for sulfatase activity
MSGGDPARRVLRGGSWGFTPQNLRSAYRIRFAPDIRDVDSGFRIARTF